MPCWSRMFLQSCSPLRCSLGFGEWTRWKEWQVGQGGNNVGAALVVAPPPGEGNGWGPAQKGPGGD
eukprot:7420742-Prorocentrum_lima.AAC.1